MLSVSVLVSLRPGRRNFSCQTAPHERRDGGVEHTGVKGLLVDGCLDLLALLGEGVGRDDDVWVGLAIGVGSHDIVRFHYLQHVLPTRIVDGVKFLWACEHALKAEDALR